MLINEIFLGLQGEGLLMGRPTVFIRTAGCNLACAWCDTEYARSFDSGHEMTIADILGTVSQFGVGVVCVTGGEPLLQPETIALLAELIEHKYLVCVETNGSQAIHEICERFGADIMVSMDIKCPSSGMDQQMCWSNLAALRSYDQLKFVLADQNDLTYALSILDRWRMSCPVIMTPVGGVDLKWLADCVLSIRRPEDIRVLPQLHKMIWGPDARGV